MDNENIKMQLKNQRACVVIPTYNNAGTIEQVINTTLEYCDDILVVNDGSTDNTNLILNNLKDIIKLISYTPNRGKGYALRQAFKQAKKLGYDYAITMDSDGQHSVEDLVKFANAIDENPNALVVGSRMLNAPNMPQQNTFANKFSNFWFTVQTAHKLPDTQSGFRTYPLQKIGKMHFVTNRYETELEILVRSAWKGIKIIPIPIQVYYPPQEERISHFRPKADFTRISILNTVLCILAIVYGYPSMLIHKLISSK